MGLCLPVLNAERGYDTNWTCLSLVARFLRPALNQLGLHGLDDGLTAAVSQQLP